MTAQEGRFDTRRVPVVLGERVFDLLQEAGASETEMYAALEIAKALIPACSAAGATYVERELAERAAR